MCHRKIWNVGNISIKYIVCASDKDLVDIYASHKDLECVSDKDLKCALEMCVRQRSGMCIR